MTPRRRTRGQALDRATAILAAPAELLHAHELVAGLGARVDAGSGPTVNGRGAALSATRDLTDVGRSGYSGRAIPTPPYGDGPASRD